MQTQRHPALRERALYYWARLCLREALDKNDEPSLTAWARFLTATADDDLETLAMENPVLKQAKDALERLSADPESRVRAEQREMALISTSLVYRQLAARASSEVAWRAKRNCCSGSWRASSEPCRLAPWLA
jgi:hypothetical protein